jgi:hypothetical protein
MPIAPPIDPEASPGTDPRSQLWKTTFFPSNLAIFCPRGLHKRRGAV